MLQHEQVSPTAPLNYAPPNYTPITPHELAQAVVAVEEQQGNDTQATIDPAVIRQTLEQGRINVTPEQLLKEVQMQRIIAHQDTAMTGRKRPNLPLQLLTGATILASLTAVVLYANKSVVERQLQAVSASLADLQAKQTNKPYYTASEVLKTWVYPGAKTTPSSTGNLLSSVDMTTSDAYADVKRYYARQVSSINPTQGRQAADNKSAFGIPSVGMIQIDGQIAEFTCTEALTNPAAPITTFTQHSARGTVTGVMTYDPVHHKTIISLVVATPIAPNP